MKSKIEIVHCPSGFWAVMVNDRMYTAASRTKEDAERIVEDFERRAAK